VREFRSFQVSFLSLFKAVVGGMDYEALSDASRYYGPIYFITFQIVVLLIMVNVFLAIMNGIPTACTTNRHYHIFVLLFNNDYTVTLIDAYTAVRLEDSESPELDSVKFGLGGIFAKAFTNLRTWFGKRSATDSECILCASALSGSIRRC
jgi:hypothetical protein